MTKNKEKLVWMVDSTIIAVLANLYLYLYLVHPRDLSLWTLQEGPGCKYPSVPQSATSLGFSDYRSGVQVCKR